ncbi:MAG: YdeI/OmpD-associated family protein [Bacteroidales bacterium]|nr:YdeI/OmpD-associated family protein [Bacteroidales bacterium]
MLVQKLNLKPGAKALVLNSPEGFSDQIKTTAENVTIDFKPKNRNYDFVMVFLRSQKDLEGYITQPGSKFPPETVLWFCYPKKSGSLPTDLNRDKGWEPLKKMNFRPVSQISIDETWSALRFKPPDKTRLTVNPDIPEIDFDNRKVYPPSELLDALRKAGILDKFEKMSFTHKKEYVQEIVEAKKPETRETRIRKTIEMIQSKK